MTTISRVDGEPAITIAVTKLPSANTVDVSKGVLAVLPDLEDDLDGATFTVVFDQAPYIQQSIESLAIEGLLGLFFAVLVILVFLLSVRATLVTAISIPTSVLITFIGIQAFGFSLNILTLGALTIAIGRVVDDSIVVIENIKRHYVGDADKKESILRAVQRGRDARSRRRPSRRSPCSCRSPSSATSRASSSARSPSRSRSPWPLRCWSRSRSCPVLAYWFLRPGKPLLDAEGNQIDPEAWDAPPSRLQKGYLPILRWTLRHSWVTLGLAALVLVGTIAISPLMKTNFLGDSGQNTFTVTQDIGAAPSLEAEDAAAQQVEEVLLDIEGIETVQVSIGSSGSALRDAFSGGGSGITYSITTDPDVDQVALREEVQAAVADLEDVGTITVAASGGGFGSSDIAIDVTAPDSQTLQEATDAVVEAVSAAEGIGQVSSNLVGIPPLHLGRGRPRRGRRARPLGSRRRRARVEHDAAAGHRHRRDRRHLADGLPRRIADAGDDRRAARAHRSVGHRPDSALGRRDRRGERGPDLDHDRGRVSAPPPSRRPRRPTTCRRRPPP